MNVHHLAKLLMLTCLCALFFGGVHPGLAQNRTTGSTATTGMPRETGNNESYRLGTGDKIKPRFADGEK
jgi:hypothetical protein